MRPGPNIAVSVLAPLPAERDPVTGAELAAMPAIGVVQVSIQGDGHTTVVALSTPDPDNLERWANNLIACAATMRKANAGESIANGPVRVDTTRDQVRTATLDVSRPPPEREPGDAEERLPSGAVVRRRR